MLDAVRIRPSRSPQGALTSLVWAPYRTFAETVAHLRVPVGRVADIGEVLDDPATHARAMVLSFERDDCGLARVVNSPFKFDGEAPSVRRPPPRMGEHNEERLQRSKKGRSDAASV